MVGEGGNLGLTQRGRIEYALGGGRMNTDAIDNSARRRLLGPRGQHQDPARRGVADGDLTLKQRNELLVEMTEAVAELVLKNDYEQTETLASPRRRPPA